jgi:putative spermidine/putrescine transport system substrate-binding protein
MNKRILLTAGLAFLLVLVVVACAAPATAVPPTPVPVPPTPVPVQPTAAPAQPTAAPAQPTAAPAQPTAAPAQPTAASASEWDQIVAKAKAEGTVNWTMWGGSEQTNKWVDNFVGSRMQALYGIKVTRTAMDAPQFVQKVMAEKQAGTTAGTIDLLWINGENFTTLKNNGALYGPFADKLPNAQKYIDFNDPGIMYDFGTPTDKMESAYGHAQYTFYYNSKYVTNPPTNLDELKAWIKANPGRFTYPAPPDFTGYTFVKQVWYKTTGGPSAWTGPFDQKKFDSQSTPTWDWLNEVKPDLWRQGKTYPDSEAAMWTLYEQGELWMTMDFSPFTAAANIANGTWPDTTRPVVFTDGTIANNNFVAIPYDAQHPNAAMVLSDFLLSPECQIDKLDPNERGDMMVYPASKMSADDQAKVKAVLDKMGPAVPPLDQLLSTALPEPLAQYTQALEDAWPNQVLKK